MKYLDRFFTYIKESNQFDLDEINSMLLPVKDMDIDFTILGQGASDNYLVNGMYNGHKYLHIKFKLNSLRTESLIINSYESEYISDDKVWEFLEELLSFRVRALNGRLCNECLIQFNNIRNDQFITLLLVGDKENDNIELLELSEKMKSRLYSMSTEFSYDTIVTYHGDYIMVKTSEYFYTDRKFKNLINRCLNLDSMSFGDLKIEKTKEGNFIFNKIELKQA